MKNKKRYLIFSILIILVVVFGAALYSGRNIQENNEENIVEENIETPREKTLEEKVDEEIDGMTLEEKIGQLFIISYRNKEYTTELDNILKQVKPSGFILFSENITTYENTTNYIKQVKSTSSIPMFISIDQEGGTVQRIKNLPDANVLAIPSMYKLGQTKNAELSTNVGGVLASEISEFGINLDFAPVLDIFSNPNNKVIGQRAFGSNASLVTEMALPFARGMESKGVIACFKHFPGHGDTNEDSHVELPIVYKTKEQLYQREFLPFKAAIQDNASMIMVAHIALPTITGNYTPSTLSKDIVGGILRDELNYNGVVITDSVEMKAITDNYTLKQICNLSINSGVDIILMPEDPLLAVANIKELVSEGSITEERIDESVKKILLLKHNKGLYEERELHKENIGTTEHRQILNNIK